MPISSPMWRTLSGQAGRWLFALACLVPLTDAAHGAEANLPSEQSGRPIVAAGFGYQIGDVSTITVKVYDPTTGDVLSNDTFDLNVNEGERASAGGPHDRIFAGGVGMGATDLSTFMLRVYDAKTGRFQWEGQLNLKSGEEPMSGRTVSVAGRRQATITAVRFEPQHGPEPMFVIRAVDPATGLLVWKDEFLAGGSRLPRIERIAALPGRATTGSAARWFDFTIRMMEQGGVLWEDDVTEAEAEERSHEAADDQATVLPAWPRSSPEDGAPQAL